MKKLLRKTLITLLVLSILFLSYLPNISNAGYGYEIECDTIDEYFEYSPYYDYGNSYDYKNEYAIILQWANIKDFSGLSEISNLESLTIHYVSGENLILPELPNLKELEIRYSNFTSIDLSNLTGLEKITIMGLTLEEPIIELKNMTKLKELNISTWEDLTLKLVNTNNITHLETGNHVKLEMQNCNLNNLEEVSIDEYSTGNIEWSIYSSAREVNLIGVDLKQEIIENFSNAEIMELNGCHSFSDVTFRNSNLEELSCYGIFLGNNCKIDITQAPSLRRFAYFKTIAGESNENVVNERENIISNMDDVIEVSDVGRYVYIGRKSETLKNVTLEQYITQNYPNQNKENITELEIKNTNIKDFRNLKQLPNLKKITLKNMDLTSIDFKDLESLEELYIKDSTLDGVLYLSNNENLNHLEVYLRGDLSNSIIYLNELEVSYVDFTFNEYETSNFNRLKTLKTNLDFDLYSNYNEETGEYSYIHETVYGGYGSGFELYEFLQDESIVGEYLHGQNFLCGFPVDEGNVSVENIKNAFNDKVEVNVYNANNELITDNNVMVYTGMKVEVIKKGDSYYEDYLIWSDGELIDKVEIVIYGDVNGDGKITPTDALQIIKNKNQKLFIEKEANYLAARVTENSRWQSKEPSAIDALAIIKHLNGKYEIKQNTWY